MTAERNVSLALQDVARRLQADLDGIAGEPVAFTLIVFTAPRVSYISNARREESVREIKHLLSLWEQGMPDVPAHQVA